MVDKIYIYGLSGSDGVIRYVGQSYRPKIRKIDHVSAATRGVSSHKCNWIRKVLSSGDEIEVHILEECNVDNWIEREMYWINLIPNLTNKSLGGEGSSGTKYLTSLDEFIDWVMNNIPHIKSEPEWREWIKLDCLPKKYPSRPDSVYKDRGWVSWSHFLNNDFNYLTYTELKEYVNLNGIKTIDEYRMVRLNNMPYNPSYFYKDNGWVDFYVFFNKERIPPKIKNKRFFLPYNEAKLIIKDLDITTKAEYVKWYLMNKDMGLPRNPILFYKSEWVSYNDFFGNSLPRNIKHVNRKKLTHFLTYSETKKWVSDNLSVNVESQWRLITKSLPIFIPKRPDYIFKGCGWVSWPEFLKTTS